jgi:hypothetical protein
MIATLMHPHGLYNGGSSSLFRVDFRSNRHSFISLSLLFLLASSLCVEVITTPVLVLVFYGATSLLASIGMKLCYARIKLSKIVGIVLKFVHC